MKFRLSLSEKLIMWYTLVVTVSLAGFALYSYISVSDKLNSNLDSSLIKVSESLDYFMTQRTSDDIDALFAEGVLSTNADNPFSIFSHDRQSDFIGPERPAENDDNSFGEQDAVWSAIYQHLLFDRRNYYIQIADTSGKIIWKSKSLNRAELPFKIKDYGSDAEIIYEYGSDVSFFADAEIDEKSIRLFIKTHQNSTIVVAYTIEGIADTLEELFLSLLIGTPIIMVLLIGFGLLLTKFSLKSVDDITRSANEITAKNLGQRLQESEVDDEIGRLIITLNKMIERLEGSFAQIRQFTSDASHELRTPLTILRGELELVLHNDKEIEDYQVVIVSALDEVMRLSNVVDTLLELSRADTGRIRMNFRKDDLSTHLIDLAEDLEILAENKSISLNTNINQGIFIEYDQARLHQAVLNVVDNAIKYTPDGGKIDFNLYEEENEAVIMIKDSGVGMSEEELSHIFDRFYRVDKARSKKIKGTGLGLSIVKWIIDSHNGIIDVASIPKLGTVFSIRLPKIQE